MKVWINKREGGYTGGMIIAAANSAEEAHKAFHDDERFSYMFYEYDGEVYDHYYQKDGWQEVECLNAKVRTPQIIDECGYTE
jgi:hypothetical protein